MIRLKQVMGFSGISKFLGVLALFMLWQTVLAEEPMLTRRKLMDVEIGGYYMPDASGNLGGGLRFRFNMPAEIIMGFSVNAGMTFENMNNWVYTSDDPTDIPMNQYYFFDSDISDGSMDFLLGYQFLTEKRISPYFLTGYGGWFSNFEVFRAESVTVPASDGVGYEIVVQKVDKKIATEFATYIPFVLGADVKILDWLYVSPFIRYNLEIDELPIFAESFDSTEINEPINLADKRGSLSLGLYVKIPIFIDMY